MDDGGEGGESGEGASGCEPAVPVPPPNLKAKIWPTPGTPNIAPASHSSGSLTWAGGANPIPACLKITTHGKVNAAKSISTRGHPGGPCCCRVLTHDPPI